MTAIGVYCTAALIYAMGLSAGICISWIYRHTDKLSDDMSRGSALFLYLFCLPLGLIFLAVEFVVWLCGPIKSPTPPPPS